MIPAGFYRKEEKTINLARDSGVLMFPPPTPWSEAVNLRTQKGSGRSCKTLGKGPDTRTGYNNFSSIVIIETYSIVVFFGVFSFSSYNN